MRIPVAHLLDKDIFSLSSGEKQSVAIASVFALSPKIYVFDEPSANLDSEATYKLFKVLELLKSAGNTIIVSEHKLYYLRHLNDRTVFMDSGKIKYILNRQQYLAINMDTAHSYGLRCPLLSCIKSHPAAVNLGKCLL